ncbi:Uncharacterized protein dnm_011570 [Desulfonema magnum]|uniref:Uncharacterized protein n=1 Tax=Desulfonema magnum TaxID=45655 RepID=A0A975GKX1_9BACT|nr:Uncharacterized protein dnm_011570 [Desulfonema magnum]
MCGIKKTGSGETWLFPAAEGALSGEKSRVFFRTQIFAFRKIIVGNNMLKIFRSADFNYLFFFKI